jgi:hypothetical protein
VSESGAETTDDPEFQYGHTDIADIIEELGGYDDEFPETSIVVDTPTGPTVIDIPAISVDEPTTTVVLDTPTGPVSVEIPLVTDNTPTESVVVDTPSGPAVIEVPTAEDETWMPQSPTDVSESFPYFENTPTMAPSDVYMTKDEFKAKISHHFDTQFDELNKALSLAELQVSKATKIMNKLNECIVEASNKFGWYGVYEHSDVFESAVEWVSNDCVAV